MIGPTTADERAMELKNRGLAVEPAVAWRTNGIGLFALFFVLTAIGIGATWGFFELIHVPGGELLTAILCIALAETLIQRSHFFATGVESALWLGGLFLMIFALPGEGSPEALLLFALAAAVAGLRVRNALFGALSAAFVISYLTTRDARELAATFAVLLALASLVALAREWQRPSTEKLWIALLLIPPIVAAVATSAALPPSWALVYLFLAVACLVFGLRLRAHAPLIGAGVNLAIASGTLAAHDLLPLRLEWRLIFGGALLLAAGAVIARALREKSRGVVATPEALTSFDEELNILGAIAAQPQVAVPQDSAGGGRFGGAGATGDY